ncbi:hypothetical protein N5D37_12815 [Comamonas aquatica]|uniref:hypothetical protein n=1 Tax=Comamonas aquatica TaxID=225991 RepID=UPI00244B9190|nr:hypothetical protein [Comamonas aquatica]MDH1766508.1 hypothetical protein [Comamonas aquatica]
MPSFNDCIVVPFGLAELAGASSAIGVLAYADGQYLPAMSAAPVNQHTVFVAHSRNGKFVACLCRVLSETQYPPSVSFSNSDYQVDVYDTDSWQRVHTINPLETGTTFPNAVVVSNAGVVAIAASIDGVRVVDAVGKAELAMLTFADGPPAAYRSNSMAQVLDFSPSEDYLFVARVAYGVAAFKTADWTRDAAMKLDAAFYDPEVGDDGAMQSPTNWLKFSPTGDAVYLYGPEHGFRGKSWPALQPLTLPAFHMGGSVCDLGFSPDGQTLFYTLAADVSGVGALTKLDLADAGAEPVDVLVTAADTFQWGNIGFSLSADGTKVALMGYAPGNLVNREYGGADQAATVIVADTGTGAVEKTTLCTIRGNLSGAFYHFAVWLPVAKLQLVTGLIKDEAGAGVVRTVVLQPREQDSPMRPYWTQSDSTGRFKVPAAVAGKVLNRIALDSTGNFNDLIDKVQV